MYYMQGRIQRRVREKEGGGGSDPPLMFKIHTCKIYNLYSKPIFYMNYKIFL